MTEYIKENGDYLLFAGAMIAGFALAAILLPRARARARIPWLVLALAATVLLAGWWFADRDGRVAHEQIQRVVESLAPTYAIELERMGHARLTAETKPDDALYLAMVETILRWQSVNVFAHDIYTIRKLPDGRNVFIVDPETDYNRDGKFEGETEERTAIGAVFEEADEGMEAAFAGRANFNAEIVTDEWGKWVGAWAPIRGPDGKVEAVVGVDFAAGEWIKAKQSARRGAMLIVGLVLVVVGIFGVAMGLLRAELLKRTEAEHRSRKAESRMAHTLQRMPLGFIEWDTTAACIAWNPAAERIFGHRAGEMLGRRIFPLIIAPAAREHVDKMWAHLLRNVGGSHSINDNITAAGRTIICEWYSVPLVGPSGVVESVVSIVQDITERVSLEKHVQQAQRLNAVGQLAAGVAHDFNNILTIITGHAGLLLDDPRMPGDVRPDIERIEDAALRASGLTRQLLAFSRQQAMFPRALHLEEIVENSAAMLGRVLGDDVSLGVRIDDGVPAVEADPAMLDQIVANLVLNARDAMPRGGTVMITVQSVAVTEDERVCFNDPDARAGRAVCLSVSDNGSGIAPEHIGRVFEPFFTTKQTGKGTGLGLSVVHGIVKQHHGWIAVESELGKGTTFRIFLPPTDKLPDADALRRPLAQDTPAPDGRTILLVEDEAIVRDLARMILERAGYRVIEACDGNAALLLWPQHRDEVDLLLTDMVMPGGVTGLELSQRLLAERPGLPVIFASGYSVEFTAPGFHESAKQVFLQKPYLTGQLVATIRRMLGEV